MKAPTPVRSTVAGPLMAVALLAALPLVASGQTHETIHSFPNEFQFGPEGALLHASNGKWYGLTAGGPYGKGSIYTLTPDGSGGFVHDEIHVFRGSPEGELPRGGLVEASDGFLYGITTIGGAENRGTVFRLDSSSGTVAIIHSFSPDEGTYPNARLIDASDGHLYGATSNDAAHGRGSVFRIDASGALGVVHHFTQDEGYPAGELIEASDGYFYGGSYGGINGHGSVYRLDGAGQLTSVHEFSGPDGRTPLSGLVQAADGNLYGGTIFGGSTNEGTIYRIDPEGGFELLHSFDGLDGYGLHDSLAEASDGYLYGVTNTGGDAEAGTIFRMGTDGSFESVLSFSADGVHYPSGPLTLDGDGLIGAATAGSGVFKGAVYRLDEAWSLGTLHEFFPIECSYPVGELVEAEDGKLYGSAGGGGLSSRGALFRTDVDGHVEIVHSFTESEGSPAGRLTEASDGFLYGTTYNHIGPGRGTVYQLGLAGDLTVLHGFTEEEYPGTQDLLEGSDGNLYGTSNDRVFRIPKSGDPIGIWQAGLGLLYFAPDLIQSGGFLWGTVWHNDGFIFRVDLAGTYTYPFPYGFSGGGDGRAPSAGLLLGSDGNFYGTTAYGGSADAGTVFRYEPEGGVLTTLYTFAGRLAGDGQVARGRLLESPDGYLYGITTQGGLYDRGMVFRVRRAGGAEEVLHHFGGPGDENAETFSGLIRASDGKLYGTSFAGGEYGAGTVYRIDPDAILPVTGLSPTSGPPAGGTTITIAGGPFAEGTSVWLGQQAAAGAIANAPGGEGLAAITPALPPGLLHSLFLADPDGHTGSLSRAWFADFLDVPQSSIYHYAVESLVRNGVTVGCGNGNYCPDAPITRAQLAVVLLKATQGAAYVPPPRTGTVFGDVYGWTFGAAWIEDLGRRGITAGCGNGNYCPDDPVTRDQMAVFLLKSLYGAAYTPPQASGIFDDVPTTAFAADWIEDLYNRSITAGCSAAPLLYCPESDVTRGQMAGLLANTFVM